MKLSTLLVLLCVAVAATAQTTSTQQEPPATPAARPAEGTYKSGALPTGISPDLLKAPQPGHPLDPGDVMVLTGKDKPQEAGYRPQIYYNYGAYTGAPNPYYAPYGYGTASPIPLLSGGGALDSNVLGASGMLDSNLPLLFGNIGGRPFFVIGDTRRSRANQFFTFPGGLIAPFTPVSPFFTFGNFLRPPQFGTTQNFGPPSSKTRATRGARGSATTIRPH